MEALIVAFELVWKIAKVNFVDDTKAASAERTGGVRFPKKLTYSINADIIHTLIESNRDSYIRILMSWVGINVGIDHNLEMNLVHLLTAMSETAIFKLVDGTRDVIFNQNSIYEKILETHDKVDLNGDKEAKGSLRILKSLLSDSMNPYLEYSNGVVKQADSDNLEDYQIRVETFLKLSATKVVGIDENGAESTGFSSEEFEEIRLTTGCNVLLYGVPGSGKSWTIEHEYCDDEDCMERLVFHPDYMYSDFVGQILPIVKKDEEGKEKVRYEFTPGPFTKILKKAYLNPSKSYYLIIEEINRGNAPAIFGEIFQLLDRQTEDSEAYKKGTSEYGITNDNIAFEVYGDTEKKVRIPANLSIIGTMNTSDQNVFTLDTAFQRRWIMRMIPNSFKGHKFAENKILDTEVSWQQFCEAINEEILRRNNVTSSEDKRLGAYFVSADDLDFKKETDNANEKEKIEVIHKNARFAEKVLKYLWDDAFKFSHADTFDTRKSKSLEMVIDAFNSTNGNDRFKVFHENLRKLIIEGVDESNVVSESEED
ncbi:ATPase [Streptococcus anginosus]|nr:ATPase [Streptococcus anginosus]